MGEIADVEKPAKAFARSRGWLVYKFTSPGKRHVPDDLFLRGGVILFIEFKDKGKMATKAQLYEHGLIRAEGFEVYVIDNLEDAKVLLA